MKREDILQQFAETLFTTSSNITSIIFTVKDNTLTKLSVHGKLTDGKFIGNTIPMKIFSADGTERDCDINDDLVENFKYFIYNLGNDIDTKLASDNKQVDTNESKEYKIIYE